MADDAEALVQRLTEVDSALREVIETHVRLLGDKARLFVELKAQVGRPEAIRLTGTNPTQFDYITGIAEPVQSHG